MWYAYYIYAIQCISVNLKKKRIGIFGMTFNEATLHQRPNDVEG